MLEFLNQLADCWIKAVFDSEDLYQWHGKPRAYEFLLAEAVSVEDCCQNLGYLHNSLSNYEYGFRFTLIQERFWQCSAKDFAPN